MFELHYWFKNEEYIYLIDANDVYKTMRKIILNLYHTINKDLLDDFVELVGYEKIINRYQEEIKLVFQEKALKKFEDNKPKVEENGK